MRCIVCNRKIKGDNSYFCDACLQKELRDSKFIFPDLKNNKEKERNPEERSEEKKAPLW